MVTDNSNARMSLTPVDDKNAIQNSVTDNGWAMLFFLNDLNFNLSLRIASLDWLK
jgi:hypothetical protein